MLRYPVQSSVNMSYMLRCPVQSSVNMNYMLRFPVRPSVNTSYIFRKKSKILANGLKEYAPTNIKINEQIIEKVKVFKYLGSIIFSESSSSREGIWRLLTASSAIRRWILYGKINICFFSHNQTLQITCSSWCRDRIGNPDMCIQML